MRLLALHGKAGAGKDTFADRLVERHSFLKRGFADPLYEEVTAAFKVNVAWLRDRGRKELSQDLLRIYRCYDDGFIRWADVNHHALLIARSPRQILQWWGTEYRRSQSETYWVDQMGEFIARQPADVVGVVIPDCRFLNEGRWVCSHLGRIIKIVRPDAEAVNAHVSELPLPDYLIDRTIHNIGSISYLHAVADSTIRGAERINNG